MVNHSKLATILILRISLILVFFHATCAITFFLFTHSNFRNFTLKFHLLKTKLYNSKFFLIFVTSFTINQLSRNVTSKILESLVLILIWIKFIWIIGKSKEGMNHVCKYLVIGLVNYFTFSWFLNSFHLIVVVFFILSPLSDLTNKEMVSNIT